MQRKLITLIAISMMSVTMSYAQLIIHATNGTYGCRRAFGHGVYNASANKTVISWNGENMSIYVREYDHETREWSNPAKIHGLNYTGKWDYHNYPCITLAPDGHYLIFYFSHSSSAYMVKSPAPNGIAGSWSHKKISDDKCAYPMPVVVGDTVYLFYSSTVAHWHRPYRMIKSTDNGETWSKPVTLIDTGHNQPEKYDEVYAHGFSVDEGGKDRPPRILLGWEMAAGPKGHNKGGYGNFFAYFNCHDQKMYTAGGKDLGASVDLEEIFSDCIINDAKNPDSRLFGYTTFPEILPDGSTSVLYALGGKTYSANWKQNSWQMTEIEISGRVRDYQRTRSGTYVILSHGNEGITVWESRDGVTDWNPTSVTELPAGKGDYSSTIGFIDGFEPEVQWLAATFNREMRMQDYSGKWPVYTFDVSSQSKADHGTPNRELNVTPNSAP